MKLLMHVLKKNPKLNINNETITFKEISSKLSEEFIEVLKAIINYNKNKTLENLKEIIRETYDLIQMCILILWKCHRISKMLDIHDLIKEINIEHKDKLSDRGWVYETGIEIDIKE